MVSQRRLCICECVFSHAATWRVYKRWKRLQASELSTSIPIYFRATGDGESSWSIMWPRERLLCHYWQLNNRSRFMRRFMRDRFTCMRRCCFFVFVRQETTGQEAGGKMDVVSHEEKSNIDVLYSFVFWGEEWIWSSNIHYTTWLMTSNQQQL